jgi:hypothetical protein
VKRFLLVGPAVAIMGIAAVSPAAFAAPSAKPGPRASAARTAPAWNQAKNAAARDRLGAARQPILPTSATSRVPHLAPALQVAAGAPGASPRTDPQVGLERDGTVAVTVTGPGAVAAVKAADGQVLAEARGYVSARVAPHALLGLARSNGIEMVAPSHKAYVAAGPPSEGVAASGANTWVTAGKAGAGTIVAIVDAGFGGLGAAGLGPLVTVAGNHCGADLNVESHGTAVAEIVHEEAPGATIVLYCVQDSVGFAQAENELEVAGATVVNCSLGFTPDARGDGTGLTASGGYQSAALTVKKARLANILWVNSSGNNAQDHWSGNFVDADSNTFVDLLTAADDFDGVILAPGDSADLFLAWDQWPSSTLSANIQVDVVDAATFQTNFATIFGSRDGVAPSEPVRDVALTNIWGEDVALLVSVRAPVGTPKLRYDLSYWGGVGASKFAGQTAATAARAAAGSIVEPASSPYAMAVGAAYWNGGALEDFSSRGPTIDGRTKPDLLGFDGVSSLVYGMSSGNHDNDFNNGTGFFGTSAASPHVAGAAALVKAASIAAATPMDASETQAFLEARAIPSSNPATNAAGRGLLNLGQPTGIAPDEGSLFTPMDPVRVLDTRPAYGGAGIIQPNHEVTVTPPLSVPSDATAVMMNLTGVGATGPAFLSAYPNSYSGVSNVDLSKTDPTLAVAATVALNTNHQFKVRASVTALNALVDVVGYYRPASAASGTGFHALTPIRILDTRTATGGHQRPVLNNEQMTIHATGGASGVPSTATAVMFNLTAVNVSGPGYLSAFPTVFKRTSTLNYGKYTMANMATVQLASGPSPAAGTFQLLNRGPAVNAIIDVVGYFDASAPSQFHVLPSPVRIADTRTGNGGRYGALAGSGPNATLTLDVAGVGEVPLSASAVWVGVIAVPTSTGYLTVYPAGQAKPLASTVDFTSGRAIANAAVSGLGSGDFSITESGGATHAVADLFGYFR